MTEEGGYIPVTEEGDTFQRFMRGILSRDS